MYPTKRLLDVAIAVAAGLLLAPVWLVVAALIRLTMGRPVLFRQVRPGRGGVPFTLCKFRTMTTATGADGRLLPDGERLTRLGRWLRRTSLDELPELLNILKGEMSLVGPRPLLMEYLPYYTARERTRFAALPGLTGWAQVNGRNELSWDRRLACDAWYVEHASLALDLKILWLTLLRLATGRGVHADTGSVESNLADERRRRGAAPPPPVALSPAAGGANRGQAACA